MKKILCVFLASALCGSALAGCDKTSSPSYTGEPVTDRELLAALNSFEAGSFGSRFYYPNMLNDFIDSSFVYRYMAENGVKDWVYCAYMKSEDYDGVDVSEAAKDTTRFYYQNGNDYVDGKHIGYYQSDSVNVADTVKWFKIQSLEQVFETCTLEGVEYKLDLVMAEKTYVYLYDCTAGEKMNEQISCFIRRPCKRENGVLSPVSDVREYDQDGYWQDQYFREQSGEYLTCVNQKQLGKYGVLNRLVDDKNRYALAEIEGKKYIYFPTANDCTKEEFLLFVCKEDDARKEEYSSAFLSRENKTYLDFEILLPLFKEQD